MKSKILQLDHKDKIKSFKKMTPDERVLAFFNHSQLLTEFRLSTIQSSKNHSKPLSQ